MKSKEIVLRHVITPSVSYTYTPDFGKSRYGYYETYTYTDENGEVRMAEYSPYEGSPYSYPGKGVSQNVSFSLKNNLEMKMASDKDTTGYKKISLIDDLSGSLSYDIAQKRWSNLSLTARLKLTKSYTFNMNAMFATYAYKFDENVSFYVHSIFDDGQWDTLKKSEENPNEFAIGTFHGPVAGCKTDSGLELPSDIRVEHFVNKNYDLVLLGDIHAKQHLNKSPFISYPGSTLQNAYDEGLKRYGFLWDIDLKTKKVSCQDIELINPCPFYTLDFVDANTTIEIIKKLPKNSRIIL
jgi:hypothetical protein